MTALWHVFKMSGKKKMEELEMTTFVFDHHGFGMELVGVVNVTMMVEFILALTFWIVGASVGLFIVRAALDGAWSHDGDGRRI